MAEDQPDSLMAGLQNVFNSSDYSDLIIRCEEREWRVHRAIICPQSKFFAVACNGVFKEAQTNTVILEDDDPGTVERMLTFLYTRNYDDQVLAQNEESVSTLKDPFGALLEDNGHETSSLAISEIAETAIVDGKATELSRALINIAVYAIAEKYNLKDLKKTALTRCSSQTWATWPLDDLRVVAKEIYTSTPSSDRGLRDRVICDCADHAQALTEQGDWISLIKMDADFGFDLFQRMSRRHMEAITNLEVSQLQKMELLREKFYLEQSRDELQKKIENFDMQLNEALETARNTDDYRHCHEVFNSWLEHRGRIGTNGVRLVLRCSKCQTRHAI